MGRTRTERTQLVLSTGHVVDLGTWLEEWGVESIVDLPAEAR